jgi:hypothetical protein
MGDTIAYDDIKKAELAALLGLPREKQYEACEFTKDGVKYCAVVDWESGQVHFWEDKSKDSLEEFNRKTLLFAACGKHLDRFGGPHGNTSVK